MQSLFLPLPEAGKTHIHFPSIHSFLLQFTPLKTSRLLGGRCARRLYYAKDGLNILFFYFFLHLASGFDPAHIKVKANIATGVKTSSEGKG